MDLQEGQIYEGMVSALGGTGPSQHWIIVKPFGKTHAHSIDNPLDLHCMPVAVSHKAIDEGTLRLVETNPDHPVVRLQREKERQHIQDAHLGLHGKDMRKMLDLLEAATAAGEDYAPYAAGEILALLSHSRNTKSEVNDIRERVDVLVNRLNPVA